MSSKSKIFFFTQDVKINLPNRSHLKKFIQYIFKKESKKVESVNIIFSTDKAILNINRKYLKHDFYTDVITFDLSESKIIFAEIYISIDRVKENAQNLRISFKSEIIRVIFHGVLHLCGYNDKDKREKKKIKEKEDFYLKKHNWGS